MNLPACPAETTPTDTGCNLKPISDSTVMRGADCQKKNIAQEWQT